MTLPVVEKLLGRAAVEAVRRPIEEGRGLGRAAYVDEDFFRLERQRLFRRHWIAAAFGHEVPMAGDAVPIEAAGLPVILLRDQEGTIRAFHNACRHRGARILAEKARQRRSLACPYHGWTYGLDGALRAAPLWDGRPVPDAQCLERLGRGLVPVRAALWQDVVFLDFSGEAGPIEAHVAPLTRLWAPYALDEFHLAHYEAGEIPANWKLAVEAAVENYHEPFVHQALPARIDKDGKKSFDDAFEDAMFGFTWKGDSSLRSATPLVPMRPGFSEETRTDNLCFLFPNTQMNLFGDVAVRTVWEPLAAGHTRWRSSWYLVGEAAEGAQYARAREEMAQYWRQLRAEDSDALALMQQGRRSPVADDVKLSPFWDGAIHRFHNLILDALEAGEEAQAWQ